MTERVRYYVTYHYHHVFAVKVNWDEKLSDKRFYVN